MVSHPTDSNHQTFSLCHDPTAPCFTIPCGVFTFSKPSFLFNLYRLSRSHKSSPESVGSCYRCHTAYSMKKEKAIAAPAIATVVPPMRARLGAPAA